MYDVLIIGAGPAGLSAAIYTARKKLSTLVLSKNVGGQTAWSSYVENYLGTQGISGVELSQQFLEHVLKNGVEVKDGAKHSVVSLEKKGDFFVAKTQEGKVYEARSVIVASGKIPRKLNVAGENEFLGKGLTYCATCDAPLFGGKTVAVIGGGNSAMDAALQLDKIAQKIYVINIMPTLQGDPVFQEKVLASPRIQVFLESQVTAILGGKTVAGIRFKQKGEEKELDVQGVFIEIGSLPSVDFLPPIKKNSWNEVEINLACETNVPGLFAAGDVTSVPEKQTIVAAGEGAKAGLKAFEFLTKQKDSY